VKMQIEKLRRPCMACVDLVFAELKRIGAQSETTEIARFGKFRAALNETVTSMLKRHLEPCRTFVNEVIDIELAYVNTNHPDFISMDDVFTERANHHSQADMYKHIGTEEDNEEEAHRQQQQQEQARNRRRANKGKHAQRSQAPQSQQQTAPANARPAPSPPQNVPQSQQSASGNNGKGGWFGFGGGGRGNNGKGSKEAGNANTNPFAEAKQNQSAQSSSAAQQQQQQQQHLQHQQRAQRKSSSQQHRRSSLIGSSSASSLGSSNATQREQLELLVIKRFIRSYFGIVKKNIADLVPKSIMFMLVNKSKQRLQQDLALALYKEDQFASLLSESPEIARKRKAAQDLLSILQKALQIISDVNDYRIDGMRGD